jgi:hypothetical protein
MLLAVDNFIKVTFSSLFLTFVLSKRAILSVLDCLAALHIGVRLSSNLSARKIPLELGSVVGGGHVLAPKHAWWWDFYRSVL